MVPPAPAPDDHADPAWLAEIRTILRLNEGGVVIGLQGAHWACAGPLVEVLAEGDAEVRICFGAQELLDAPKDARVVLLHAARDAAFLNLARPTIATRRLRLLVWLKAGDRSELRRRARDFLDWMQESVSVPDFVPAYAARALRRALYDGASIAWERAPLRGLVPETTPFLTGDTSEDDAVAAMRSGPVVVHRPTLAEIARFEAMHRAAGAGFGIVWNEPEALPARATRIIAEPLAWEVASQWLGKAGVGAPRIEAARLDLDPMAIASRSGREAPPMPSSAPRSESETPIETKIRARALPRQGGSARAPRFWEEVHRICEPVGPPADPLLFVPRPAAWPGLGALADQLTFEGNGQVHVVTGAVGIGVSTELAALATKLHEQHCVVMLDVEEHFRSAVGDPAALARLAPWELVALLGLAAIRVGRDRWNVRSGSATHALGESIRAATATRVDVDRLVSALAGAGAPDRAMTSIEPWTLPMGTGHAQLGSDESNEISDTEQVVDELARVLHDPDEARMLVLRAGFPASHVPSFRTPLTFWSRVIEDARNGAIRGGARAIIEAAAKIYPGNAVLARHVAHPKSGHVRHLSRAVRRIVEALRISTKREVVFVVDGLGRPSQSSLVDELLASSELPMLGAALVLAAPPVTTPRTRRRAQTFTRLDDLPVIDVHEPTEHGPGIAFLRELLERRLVCAHQARPPIQEDVLLRLCWASGGRPGECLHLVRRLALAALDAPPDRLSDLATLVLREHRSRLTAGVTARHYERLGSLLRTAVTDVPDDKTARELYSLGILRLYATSGGRHRALPHPLLIDGLVHGSVEE